MDNENEQNQKQRPLAKTEEKNRSNISTIQKVLILITALFFDLIQVGGSLLSVGIMEFVNPFISIFAWSTLWIWFKFNGVNLINKTSIAFSVAELVPILNDLPNFTAMVIKRFVDLKANQAISKVPGGGAISTIGQTAMKRGVSMKDFASKETRSQLYKDLDLRGVAKGAVRTNLVNINQKPKDRNSGVVRDYRKKDSDDSIEDSDTDDNTLTA